MSTEASSPEMVENPDVAGEQDPQEVHVPEVVREGSLQDNVPGELEAGVEDGSISQHSAADRPPGATADREEATELGAAARPELGPSRRQGGIGFVLPELSGMRLSEDSDESSPMLPRPTRRLSHELNIHGVIRETPKKRSAKAPVEAG